MLLKIFSPEDKAFRKTINRSTLFFVLLIPVLNTLILNTSSLIIYYYANSYDNTAGLIIAQIISVLSEIIANTAAFCGLCVIGYEIVRYGLRHSIRPFLYFLLAPLISEPLGIVIKYILVVLGIHDYTLTTFTEDLPKLILYSVINYLVVLILLLAVCLIFAGYEEKNAGSALTVPHSHYRRSITWALIIFGVISLAQEILTAYTYITSGSWSWSLSDIVETLALPFIYLALRLFSMYAFSIIVARRLDILWEKSHPDKIKPGIGQNKK